MTMALSHSKVEVKAKLIIRILDRLMQTEWDTIRYYIPVLQELALLSGKGNAELALKVLLRFLFGSVLTMSQARQIVMAYQLPTYKQREESICDFLAGIVNSKDPKFRQLQLSSIVASSRLVVYKK